METPEYNDLPTVASKEARNAVLFELSSVIENAPYLLVENPSLYLAASSKGSSTGGSHSGNSSHSGSRSYPAFVKKGPQNGYERTPVGSGAVGQGLVKRLETKL